jgi:hypothetical protein
MDNQPMLTPFQMELLSNIFRVMIKEIVTDEDKEKLAPGEMGINYKEGSFYIRNPHTGELFTPNSLSHLNQILSKYEDDTNLLNADRAGGIRFYSNISQLTQLGISLTADSIIRQMEYPGILMSPVEYENYEVLGMPSNSGMILVFKAAPEFVIATYYDNLTRITYQGRYNPFKQFFEGWICQDAPSGFITAEGDANRIKIRMENLPEDMEPITLRVPFGVNPGATISVNNQAFQPIITASGEPLGSTITANNIIMLIYDDMRKSWILSNSNESTINSVITVLRERVETATADIDKAVKDYRERLDQLTKSVNDDIAALKARPGVISNVTSDLTVTQDNLNMITGVTGFDHRYDKLLVNFQQTILRQGLDYTIDEETGNLYFKDIRFNSGDVLQFIVLKQARPTE